MKKRRLIRTILLAFALSLNVSCSDDSNSSSGTTTQGNYFVAAQQGDFTYLFSVPDLESGTASIVGTAGIIEQPYAFTAFVSNKAKTVTAMQYRQGDPSIGMTFGLNSQGILQKTNNEFQLEKGYGTWGTFENRIVAARSGQTLTDGTNGVIAYFIDQNNGNAVTTKYLSTTGLNGATYDGVKESATISGIVDRGNGTFLTAGVFSHGKVITEGGSTTATVGNPDECWIFELDQNLNIIRSFQDNRIGYSAGRYRSSYYSQIGKDDSNNVYVFSGAYENTSTKNAGVIRIPNGGTDFDSYYWDLEAASGGYRFRKVWAITQDYFLLEYYNEKYDSITTESVATQYAVVKMGSKKFNWLSSGFPAKENIVSTGLPFAQNGKMYFPITTDSAKPTIYVIDPAKASAKAGLVINAEGVAAVSYLE
ncbi:DUF4374 domain-containing protein [Flavobacterium sp. TSSA_36]|uniref:DUF4374 domain-containing protein n=1 Tax=Flavobacterium sp. TSSA_36 TaxID=3447669 RepID=UPI003F410591